MLLFSHLKIRVFERETVMPEQLRLFGRRTGAGGAYGEVKRCKRHGWKRLQKSDMIF